MLFFLKNVFKFGASGHCNCKNGISRPGGTADIDDLYVLKSLVFIIFGS